MAKYSDFKKYKISYAEAMLSFSKNTAPEFVTPLQEASDKSTSSHRLLELCSRNHVTIETLETILDHVNLSLAVVLKIVDKARMYEGTDYGNHLIWTLVSINRDIPYPLIASFLPSKAEIDADFELWDNAINHPNLPKLVYEKIMHEPSLAEFKVDIANDVNTPPEILVQLLNDPDYEMAGFYAGYNNSTPLESRLYFLKNNGLSSLSSKSERELDQKASDLLYENGIENAHLPLHWKMETLFAIYGID